MNELLNLKNLGLLVVVIALCTMACDNDDPPEMKSPTGLILDNVIGVDGLERSYHLFVPENYNNKPLVIMLHGAGGSSDDMIGLSNYKSPYKVWLELAEDEEFIVAVPNGIISDSDKRMWNDCRNDAEGNPDVDDVKFIEEMMAAIDSEYHFDEDRVYSVGTSNGGHMSIRLANEVPEKITAFAAIVAANPANSACPDNSVPVSALFMNGTDDPLLPYSGGQMAANRGEVYSADQSVEYWVARNNTSTEPVIEEIPDSDASDGCTATKYLYQNGSLGTEVALYRIQDGGHTEPSLKERYSALYLILVGPQNGDFEMADEVWDFFKTKSR